MSPAAGVRAVPGKARAGRILLAALLAVLPCLLFLNKAFHIDDPLFIWTARHILEHPLDFYGFDVNWYGRTQPMHEVTQNPPLVSYYLAIILRLAGPAEWALHLAMLFPAALAGAGAYHLAARFCARPLLAALLTVASPAFVVSGTTLMCDMAMLAFWLWAASLWLAGLETRSWNCVVMAALLAGFGVLSKYFGASLIPLLAVYTLCQGRAHWRYLIALALPICMLVLYETATAHLYGRGHFLDAVWYVSEIEQEYGRDYLAKILVGLIFLGGCLTFPFLVLLTGLPRPAAASPGKVVADSTGAATPAAAGLPGYHYLGRGPYLAFALGVVAVLLMGIRTGGTGLPEAVGLDTFGKLAQGCLWTAAGLAALALAAGDFFRGNWRESVFLGLWLGGVLVFVCFLNHYINVRVLLPAVVPVAILAARRLDGPRGRAPVPGTILTVGVTLIIALLAGAADYRQAGNGRQAARDTVSAPHEGRLWFVGHWGFQYYMEQGGALPLELDRPRFRAGETVVIPSNNTNIIRLDPAMIAASSIVSYPAFPLLSVMCREMGAGLHTDVWGALPFAFGRSLDESYARVVLAPPPSANP